MEDEEIAIGDLQQSFDLKDLGQPHALFGVFDGHCGNLASEFVRDHFPEALVKNPHFETDPRTALREAFLKTDADLRAVEETESGATGVVLLIRGKEVWCANLGDSRAVLSEEGCAIALSHDHKPDDGPEKRRIEELGGFVEMGRVNGILAVSRAFGDFEYKIDGKMMVEIEPEIESRELQSYCDFIVLACDGLWDVMSNTEAVDLISGKLKAGLSEKETAEFMCKHAINLGSTDNVTCLIVSLDFSED